MKTMKLGLVSAAVVGLMVGEALASGGPIFYVGAQVGYNSLSAKATSAKAMNLVTTQANSTISARGIIGGVHGGVDYPVSEMMLVGLDLSFDFTNPEAKHRSLARTVLAENIADGNVLSIKQSNRFNVAGKLGYRVNESTTPYIKVGYTNSKFEAKSTFLAARTDQGHKKEIKKSKRLGGLFLGAGVDMNLSAKVRLGFDYTYARYSKLTLDHRVANGAGNIAQRKFTPQTSTFQARLSYLI